MSGTFTDVITTRTYVFDSDGNFAGNKQGTNVALWEIHVEEREVLIPDIIISHIHIRSAYTGSGSKSRLLASVDLPCECGAVFPRKILDQIVQINRSKYPYVYGAIERPYAYNINRLKRLSEEWYLDNRDEPALFHVCNDNHPAYLYYGKGIPLRQIPMPPWPDKCKTCRVDIPKGIRGALLVLNKKVKLA